MPGMVAHIINLSAREAEAGSYHLKSLRQTPSAKPCLKARLI